MVSGKWNTSIGDVGFVLDGAFSQLTTTSQNVRMEPMFRTRISGKDYFIPGGYQYGEEDFSASATVSMARCSGRRATT
jgi:hypothetical protein